MLSSAQETASKQHGELIQAHLKISGEAIEQKTSVKYLGVILDNEMKWKDYISRISSKVSPRLLG